MKTILWDGFGRGGGGDNHELGGNYSYYMTLIVYLSTKFCNYPNSPRLLFYWSNWLEMCSFVKKIRATNFVRSFFVFFCFVSFPCPSWSVFLSIFLLFLFVGVCENHRGLFFPVVC